MRSLGLHIDPDANDPGRWAHSLINLAEIMVPCLDAIGARSVIEAGAYAGDLTGLLLEWAQGSGAQILAIDPSPQAELVALDEQHPGLELVRETSDLALRHVPLADAVIIDGDHNYYTVSHELRAIAERAEDHLPLLLFHDVGWPHGRRDDYYAAELIPAEHRHPIAEGGGLFPGVEGIKPGGLPYRGAAAREGGPRNGVLTAVEDFVGDQEGLRLAVVPAFFGLGVVWPDAAPWADEVAEVLAPWDRNPLLARLEANRVLHLARAQVELVERVQAQQARARQEAVLRRLLRSSAFTVAEGLARLRQRAGIASGDAMVTKDDIRRVLGG